MSTLKHKTISGIKWTMAASIVQRIISFGTTVILARILSPADFGLFALAFVMIDGFGIFKSLGFDTALVRRKDDTERACNTAFLLIPAMGMILFVILFIFAPIGARFLNHPQLTSIIRTLAVIFVISTFSKVPQTILYRDMKFKYKSFAEVSATLIYTSSAVILALNKLGVWSLVIAYILKTLTQASIEWYFSGWKPKFEFDKTVAWDMFHFGKFVLAGSILGFLYSNLDNVVVGKLLGVTLLGYYAISRNAANFLCDYFFSRVGMIMYPAYSKIQEDTEDVKRVMLKILRHTSTFAFPFSLGLFMFAPDILRFVFGEKWLPATNVLKILSFVGLLNALEVGISPIFLARGRSKLDFQIGFIQVVIFFLLIVPLALKFKLVGVGYAGLVATIFYFVIGLSRAKKILHFKFSEIVGSFTPALLCSLFMLGGGMLFKALMASKAELFNFLISASISAMIYLLASYFFNRNIFNDIKDAVL